MNFTEVVDYVVSITGRPDKRAAIQKAVNHRMALLSSVGDFARDLNEVLVDTQGKDYAFSLPLSTFTRFRKFKAIKPANRNLYLAPASPDTIFIKGKEVLDSYYVAGDQVNIRLAAMSPGILAAWFMHPGVLSGTDTNWMLETVPYVIIDGAAASVFKEIGDDQSFRIQEELYRTGAEAAIRDFKHGVHYG